MLSLVLVDSLDIATELGCYPDPFLSPTSPKLSPCNGIRAPGTTVYCLALNYEYKQISPRTVRRFYGPPRTKTEFSTCPSDSLCFGDAIPRKRGVSNLAAMIRTH